MTIARAGSSGGPRTAAPTGLLFIVLEARRHVLFTLHSSLITHHSSLITLHSSLFTLHSSLFTLHSSLITHPSSLFTLPSSLFPLPSSLFTLHSLPCQRVPASPDVGAGFNNPLLLLEDDYRRSCRVAVCRLGLNDVAARFELGRGVL